jgi:hypothetical protein
MGSSGIARNHRAAFRSSATTEVQSASTTHPDRESPCERFRYSTSHEHTAHSTKQVSVTSLNHPAAGKAEIAPLLAIGHRCPGLPEPERYPRGS